MSVDDADEGQAISTLMSVLKPLEPDARTHVIEFVLKRLGITLNQPPAAFKSNAEPPGDAAPDHSEVTLGLQSADILTVTDIRSFARNKEPKTVNEKVAVVAFYLAHLAPPAERRDNLITDDIRTYFIQAGFELPSAPATMTLTNAKNAGYLNALGGGKYRLNSVGHNLVAHKLPSSEMSTKRRASPKKAKKTRPSKAKR